MQAMAELLLLNVVATSAYIDYISRLWYLKGVSRYTNNKEENPLLIRGQTQQVELCIFPFGKNFFYEKIGGFYD